MRELSYKTFHPVGGGKTKKSGTLVEFLVDIEPFLFSNDLGCCIPPRTVLNSLLESGRVDKGMSGGGEWKPFSLDTLEYEELVLELRTHPTERFKSEVFGHNLTWSEWSTQAILRSNRKRD